MAEEILPSEIKKILGKRRSPEGIEYLIQLKGQRKGKEQWIKYKELLNSKHLLKEYNKAQRDRQQKQENVDTVIIKDTDNTVNSVDCTIIASAELNKVKSKPKNHAKMQVHQITNSNAEKKELKSEEQSKTQKRTIRGRFEGLKEIMTRNKLKNMCNQTQSRAVSTADLDEVISLVDDKEDSLSSHSLSDSTDSDILYSLAKPDNDEDDLESGKSSVAATSDSDEILYSLADPVPEKTPLSLDEKTQSGVTPTDEEDGHLIQPVDNLSDLESQSDSDITLGVFPAETLPPSHRADCPEPVQPGSEASSSALSAISKADKSYQSDRVKAASESPPQPSCGSSHREPSPSLASTNSLPQTPQVIPMLPSNPSLPNYDVFMRTFSRHHLSQQRGVKRPASGDSNREVVPRRVSVRNSESAFKYKQIMVKKHQHYTQIWLSSQTKCKNALNPKVFQELITALRNAQTDDTRVVLLTGSGHVFCSGIDLHYLTSGDVKQAALQMTESLKEFLRALILFPKPIVAAVNGSAVGLGVGLLPLCDVIYASDKASFYCPYTKLGQTPEGGASYMFPQTVGIVKANELLLEGRKITAQEASQIGLVSQVFWPTSMMQEVIPRVQQMALMSAQSLEATKFLIRGNLHGKLEMTINTECDMLGYLWSSPECQRAMAAFMNEDEDIMF